MAASSWPVLCEFSGRMYSPSQAVARHCLRAVYRKCPTLVYSKELDYPARYRSQTWKECQARLLSCKHKKPQISTGNFERVGSVDMGKRCCSSWEIWQRRALHHAAEKRAAIGSAACWIADCLTVCAVIVRVMIPLLAAILVLGLVDILLHIIVTTVNLGSS